MAQGAQPQIWFSDLLDRDCGLNPGGHTRLLESIPQRHGVDDGRQHAHVVGVGAIHADGCRRQSTEDVAATDDDGDLVTFGVNLGDLLGGRLNCAGVDPVVQLWIGKRLSRKLEDHAAGHEASDPSPTASRVKLFTEMFSPIFAAICLTISPTVPSNFSERTKPCSISTLSW